MISRDEVPAVLAAFLLAHPDCPDAVEFTRLADTLVCFCEVCGDLRTYVITH